MLARGRQGLEQLPQELSPSQLPLKGMKTEVPKAKDTWVTSSAQLLSSPSVLQKFSHHLLPSVSAWCVGAPVQPDREILNVQCTEALCDAQVQALRVEEIALGLKPAAWIYVPP